MIELRVNNNQVLVVKQNNQYGDIEVSDYDIPASDFVMLLNYYRYIKDNNIQCDFINPSPRPAP
jgi:hypothetical protein